MYVLPFGKEVLLPEVTIITPMILFQRQTRLSSFSYYFMQNHNFGFSLKIPESGVLKDARYLRVFSGVLGTSANIQGVVVKLTRSSLNLSIFIGSSAVGNSAIYSEDMKVLLNRYEAPPFTCWP